MSDNIETVTGEVVRSFELNSQSSEFRRTIQNSIEVITKRRTHTWIALLRG